jgi:broad specificity phosphatase PhoE
MSSASFYDREAQAQAQAQAQEQTQNTTKDNVVVFLRHGEAEHNAAFAATGMSDESVFESMAYFDCGLTDAGVAQCITIREKLHSLGYVFPVVVTSPLRRALATASIVAPDALTCAHDGLSEHLVGDCAKHPCNMRASRAIMEAQFSSIDFSKWCDDSHEEDNAVETDEQVRDRIRRAFINMFEWVMELPPRAMSNQSKPALLVVSHFGTLGVVSDALRVQPPRENCAFFVTTLEELNTAFHLNF